MAVPGDCEDIHSIDVEGYRNLLISACIANNKAEVSNLLQAALGKVGQVLNLKNKYGTTPLHEACMYGAMDCIPILLKYGKEANVFDARGYAPIHCAAYSNHTKALKVLLDYHAIDAYVSTVSVDQHSAYDETPLHIACMQGAVNAVDYLYRSNAQLDCTDSEGNNILHFISSSNSHNLWSWFLGVLEQDQSLTLRKLMFTSNKHGESVAHVAAVLGNKISVGVLAQQKMDFERINNQGKSAVDLMKEHGHTQCYKLAIGEVSPPVVQISSSPNPSLEIFKRSFSTGSGSPRSHRASFTGMDRPRNVGFYTKPSSELKLPRRGSSFSIKSGGSTKSSDSLVSAFTVSKENLNRITMEARRGSITSESAIATVMEQTAYEPPFRGFHYMKKETLTPKNNILAWDEHDVKFVTKLFLRPLNSNILNDDKASPLVRSLKHDKLEVCLSLSMTAEFYISQEYTILSPICFVSCKHKRNLSSKFSLTIPHAVNNAMDIDENYFKILSVATCILDERIESPVTEYPPNIGFTEIEVESLEVYRNRLKFRSSILNPSLFAVAMKNEPLTSVPRPIPILHCILFCVYNNYDEHSNISYITLKLYIGMGIKTVQKIMQDMCSRHNQHMKELYFDIKEESFSLHTDLTNTDHWNLESGHNHTLRFSQVALTSDTDQQSYSHELSYPPHRDVYIVPKRIEGPASCEVTVHDSNSEELGRLHCLPYSPYKSASHTPRCSPPPGPPHISTKIENDSNSLNESCSGSSLPSTFNIITDKDQIEHSSQDSDYLGGSSSTVTPNSPLLQFRVSSSDDVSPTAIPEAILSDTESHLAHPHEFELKSQPTESVLLHEGKTVQAQLSMHDMQKVPLQPVTKNAVQVKPQQSQATDNSSHSGTVTESIV